MRKFLGILFFGVILFTSFSSVIHADSTDINLKIRDGNTVVFSGPVALPSSGNIDLNDDTNTPRSINAQSVLSILNSADILSSDFNISDLQYFTSLSSLYLKCITDTIGQKCDNWQYTVKDSYPDIGMDQNILSGGENVYIYFGPQNKVVLSSNSINTNETLTVTAQKYDYQNNAWLGRSGVTVGLTQPNPNNTFSPTEVQTQPVDVNGQTVFSSIPAGSYNVGVKEDYYFPTESLTVVSAPKPSGSSGGGRMIITPPPTFSVANALAYLKSVQSSDGSFDNSLLYTDWAGIAFGAMNVNDNSKTSILAYLNSHNSLSSLLTDNERHAMALLSLGQNPYSFNGMNYIKVITDSFDSTQFGDVNLVNDDIFALIPLANTGYTANDDIIVKDIAFIISKQKTDGSWEESVDITAAAIQALYPFSSVSGVSSALANASLYLQNSESSDGGWGNVSSTSWAMQAMSALGTLWTKNNKNGLDYLGEQQTTDGAVSPSSETLQNRIWATSYAIAAGSSKPWNAIMQSVSKPVVVICPIGNLFSATTGQACTATAPIDSASLPQANSKIITTSTSETVSLKNKTKLSTLNQATSQNSPINEINSKALSATAVNALPDKTASHTFLIVLEILSGIILLYLVIRFLIK